MTVLRRLPAGTFDTVYDLWEALGGEIEHVTGRPDRHSIEARNRHSGGAR